jgi:hypothetical protein
MGAVATADEGFASGAIALSRSLFGVFGIAVLGSLLAAGIAHETGARVYHQSATAALSQPAAYAFAGGMHVAMLVCFALTLVFGLAVIAMTPGKSAPVTEHASA